MCWATQWPESDPTLAERTEWMVSDTMTDEWTDPSACVWEIIDFIRDAVPDVTVKTNKVA